MAAPASINKSKRAEYEHEHNRDSATNLNLDQPKEELKRSRVPTSSVEVRGASVEMGCEVQVLFNGDWLQATLHNNVQAGLRVLFSDRTSWVIHPTIIDTHVRTFEQAAAQEKEEQEKSKKEWEETQEQARVYRASLRERRESDTGDSIQEPDYFDVGTQVELKLHGGGWQRGSIKKVVMAECKSWRDFDIGSGESRAYEIIAYDESGAEHYLGFNGKNCDPLPVGLTRRFLRKFEEGSNDVYRPGDFRDGLYRSFLRMTC
jgi:hypothetical protein